MAIPQRDSLKKGGPRDLIKNTKEKMPKKRNFTPARFES